jgi:hypothetical protein
MSRTPNRDNLIKNLVETLTAEHRGTIPAVRSPQRHLSRHAAERRGFLARLFDPAYGLEVEHDLERFKIELTTETELLKLDAKAAIEKKRIQIETAIQDFQDKADQWRKVSHLENAGLAEIVKYQKFQELVNLTADLNLDPLQQELLIARLYHIFLPKEEMDDDAS